VLLDAAGTLIELREPVGETYSRLAREFGVERAADELDRAFHRVFAQSPAMVFPHAPPAEIPALERDWWRRCVEATFSSDDGGGPFDTPENFERYFAALFIAMGSASAWRVVDGGFELLRKLRSLRFGIAIVSNFDFRLRGLLDELSVAPLIDAVVLAADVGAAKPDPALFERAMSLLRVSPGETWVVGDHPDHDIAAGRSAGLRAVDIGTLATLGDLAQIIDDATAR